MYDEERVSWEGLGELTRSPGGRNRGDVEGGKGTVKWWLVELTRLWEVVELLAVRVGVSRTLSSCWS